MKRTLSKISAVMLTMAVAQFLMAGCLKSKNPIVYETGTFPDTIIILPDLNSEYDDYNLDIYSLYANIPLIFSSNRSSQGGKFNLEQGVLSYAFNQTDGTFLIGAETINDSFLAKLLGKVNTTGNDFGPYRLYSASDGYEYLILASETTEGNLDFYFTKNLPVFGTGSPDVLGPYPVKLLNSSSNEAYISMNNRLDTAYFSSDADGNFDIYYHLKPGGISIETWLNKDYEVSTKVEGINSTSDDKCPAVYGNILVFTSNRPGGSGGYDLYYSKLVNGHWSTPVNFGPKINTASDEYRPLMGGQQDFSNSFIMFSSNRTGGKGGFDIYFSGVDL